MLSGRGLFGLAVSVAVTLAATANAAEAWKGVEVKQEKVKLDTRRAKLAGRAESDAISVTVPGHFKAVFCDGYGHRNRFTAGLGCFYDLKNDPKQKYDYARPWPGGLLPVAPTVKPRREYPDNPRPGCLYPSPGTLELVEAYPVRAVVRHTWRGRAYGLLRNTRMNPDVEGQQTFVVYGPDRIYQTFSMIGIGEEVHLSLVPFTLHTSHAKWSGGTTMKHGKFSIPGPWTFLAEGGKGPKKHVLHVAKPGTVKHADGTVSHHKANFLLVTGEDCHYAYRGGSWIGYRTAVRSAVVNVGITKGKRADVTHAVLIVNHDVTDVAKAAPYAKEYREPGVPKFRKGAAVGDGYDEAMGSYTMKADGDKVDFDLPVLVHQPVFEITGWQGGAPGTIQISGKAKTMGDDYLAHAKDGKLLVQVMEVLPEGTAVVISR